MTKVTIDREERYTVIKHKDLTVDDRAELDQFIQSRHIPTRKCLVIESDWPEYEPAWRMIEARVTGASTKPAAVPSLNQQLLEALEGMLLHIREPESESEFQWSGHFKKQKAAFVAARAAIAAARKGEV